MKFLGNIIQLFFLLGGLIVVCGCANTQLKHYENTTPAMDIKAYFNGQIKAWGIVQDWRGRVVNRFEVHMVGRWEGDSGVLEEDFVFYDGKKQHRTWHIERHSSHQYSGSAGDIIGRAQGEQNGAAVRWAYTMDVPVGDRSYRLGFDDWMWQMNDGVLINRSYMKKLGITVAELTLFMQKVNPDETTGTH